MVWDRFWGYLIDIGCNDACVVDFGLFWDGSGMFFGWFRIVVDGVWIVLGWILNGEGKLLDGYLMDLGGILDI